MTNDCPYLAAYFDETPQQQHVTPQGYSNIACHILGDSPKDERRYRTADAMLWQNVLIEGRPNDPQQIERARSRAVEAFSVAGQHGFIDC